ncbi:hypothetical protein KUTeg_023177 [Tegillarca granosa]|uniref:Uncharacterized protein n=1 Tax=Tegillarca granosa TaxID=220873 RepID=A0ABQ9E5F3_TEGGR|nr:hypothetical protein KUTeg_023177 [Tegillarca granosa]
MKETTSTSSTLGTRGVLTKSWPRYCLHGLMDTIPMKRKRISPIQDALYWCRAKRDKDGFVIKFINNFIGSGVFTQKNYDATYSHGKGRMINDAVGKNINCIPKVVIVDKNPRICFLQQRIWNFMQNYVTTMVKDIPALETKVFKVS